MRVLVPTTLSLLARAVPAGSLGVVDGVAFAVTPASVEMHSDGDEEELELLAAEDAAAASLRLLAAADRDGATVPARRVVVVAEVPDGQVTVAPPGGEDEPDLVHVAGPVALDTVDCVLADPASAADLVAAALPVADDAPLELGALPDGPAWEARDEVEANPLLWFDRSEIDALTAGVPTEGNQ